MTLNNTNNDYQLIFSKLLNNCHRISSWLLYGSDLSAINRLVDSFATEVLNSANEDLLSISDMRIEQIRRIPSFLHTTSARNGYKVVVVGDVAEMNVNAANALLKVLEEPFGKSIIVLISSSLYKVLETIKSRCCKVYCPSDDAALSQEEIELYHKILQARKVELAMCGDVNRLLRVVQFFICQLIKVQLNVHVTSELFLGETVMLQGISTDIEDLYRCWENILRLNQEKGRFYLLEEHINILFCNTIRVSGT